VGSDPSSFHEPIFALALDHPRVVHGQTLPSTVLQRRPDIAAAERRVKAANAGIGTARAAYLPVFDLNGYLGRESLSQSNWWSEPSLAWSGAAQGGVLLLDAGRRAATVKAAEAGFDNAVAQYRQTVLSAIADVEDQLAARQALLDEQMEAKRHLNAAQSSLKIAQAKYLVGTITNLELVAAEAELTQATTSALDTEARFLAEELNLIRAIGGES